MAKGVGGTAKKAASRTLGGKASGTVRKAAQESGVSGKMSGPFSASLSGGGSGFARVVPDTPKPTVPPNSTTPQETVERTMRTSDIDWAFSQAWPDPAVRSRLTKMIEDAVARQELDAYGDRTVFLGKMWNMVRATPEYKARFPGLARLEASAGFNPATSMTPDDYMKMEGLYDNAMSYYGIPGDVFNRNEMIADLVEKQVTPDEMKQRLQMAQDAAAANADITAKLLEYEGIQPGHIVAFYLNPDDAMAAIVRKEQTLQIGGMMSRYGFAGAKGDAQFWQQQFGGAGGLSTGSVAATLDRAVSQRNLMSGLGETADESTVLQGSAAENVQRDRLRAIAAQREGRFNTTGGALEGRTGVSGLGSASAT